MASLTGRMSQNAEYRRELRALAKEDRQIARHLRAAAVAADHAAKQAQTTLERYTRAAMRHQAKLARRRAILEGRLS